jgi:hypothetical protein
MITHTTNGKGLRKPICNSWSPQVYILSLPLLGGADEIHNSANRRETM